MIGAMRDLDTYPQNPLSLARIHYRAAVTLNAKAVALSKRSKWDEQGDAAFAACMVLATPYAGRRLLLLTELENVAELIGAQAKLQNKFAEPLSVWSDAAIEEHFPDIIQVITVLGHMLLHSDYLLSDKIVRTMETHVHIVNSMPTVTSSDSERNQHIASCDLMREAVESLNAVKGLMHEPLLAAAVATSRFLNDVVVKKLEAVAKPIDKLASLVEKLDVLPHRSALWDSVLVGTVQTLDLSAHGPQPYAEALPAYKAWRASTVGGNIAREVPVGPRPYLQTIITFSKHVSTIMTSPPPDYKRTLGTSPESLKSCIDFCMHGEMGRHVYTQHCTSKLLEGSANFCQAIDVGACTLVDKVVLVQDHVDPVSILPRLVPKEIISRLAATSRAFCKFDGEDVTSPVISSLPHLEEVRFIGTLVHRVMQEPLHVPCFLQPESSPIAKGDLNALLANHANLATLRMLSAAVHEDVLVSPIAIDKIRESLSFSQVSMLRALQAVATQAKDRITSCDFVAGACRLFR